MATAGRVRRWAVVIAVGVVVAGVGAFLAVQGLDTADKWSSVFGLFVGLAGLGLSMWGVVGVRQQGGGQAVTDSIVGSGVTQVRGVRGNVRIGPSAPAAGSPPMPAGRQRPVPGPGADGAPAGDGQSVTRSWTAGPVRQIDGVGGDVELDQ